MKKQYTKITFFLIVIVLLTISLMTYRNLSNYVDEVKWIRHSNRVLRTLELTLSSIKDAETGHRGYQLTHDSTFLIPYNKSIQEIPTLIRSLDSLVSNDTLQAKRVDSLKASIQNQLLLIPQILANARESSLYMETFEKNLLYKSKENMSVIRSQTERIKAAELILFNQQVEKENDFRSIAPIAILFYALFAIAASVIIFFRTIDVLRRREKAEQDLAQQIALVKGRELLLKEAEVLANMGSWKWALKDDTMVWSDGMHRILGQSHTFALSWNTFMESVHNDDKDILQRFIDKAIATNKGFRMEYRAIVSQSIHYFYIAVTTETEAEKGNILGVVVDITVQKQKSDLVKERELLLKEAEVLASMGSWKWSLKNDTMVWSDGLYRILGQSHTFALSWNTFIESVHTDDKGILQSFIDKAIASNKGFRMEYRAIVRESIRYFYIAVTAETEIEKGNILGVVVDITDQKLKEEQLQQLVHELDEKEKKYSSLFERSIDPIFLARIDFALINLNESFLEYFGYTKEEEKNITIRQIFAEESDYTYFLKTLKEVQQIRDFEVQLINQIGQRKWCLLNCVFIPDQSPDFCCYQGIIHDITLRKRAERELVKAERISLTDKMARIVAHEIRNPLTNLNLALEQLKDEMPKNNENVTLYTDIIQRNANRIENLIGDMLNSAKPKELQLELITVNDLIEETIALALDRINLKEIVLEKKYTENLFRILVDKEKVKIALLNIIINAIEAMIEQEGKLIVATFQKEDMITISITDNGKGMSADEMEKLYEPFFTGKPSGLGLGLTSTKNILSSHNAEIHVSSEPDKGTTFSVMFKLAE